MPRLELDARRIDVWHAAPDEIDDRTLDRFRASFSPDELERCERITHLPARRLFIVGRGMLREILSRYVGCDPNVLEFCYNAYGKPSLASSDSLPLEFNVSHTPGLAVCAVAASPVGVDVERERRIVKPLEMARRFFAPAEAAALESLPPDQCAAVFVDYWTLREALVKARGVGLLTDKAEFAFTLQGESDATVSFSRSDGELASAWRFHRFIPATGYRAALAVEWDMPQQADVVVRSYRYTI